MNQDPAYARVRARRAIIDLDHALGPGLPAALARSADLLRADADHLEGEAATAYARLGGPPFQVGDLAQMPLAIRSRVWRQIAVAAGAPVGQLSAAHVASCDLLLTQWHGQGPVDLPGGVRVRRHDGRVYLEPGGCGTMVDAPAATAEKE